jgi:hypothetical protein
MITLGYIGNNSGALLKHMWGPPDKSRAIQQAFGRSILRNFNRVSFLEICQAFPACGAIFTLNTKVPTFGCVNTSGKAGAQIPHLAMGDDSPPWGG